MVNPLYIETRVIDSQEKTMEYRKQPARNRTGEIKPVGFTLVKALSGLRETNCRASEEKQRYFLTAREMLVLGKLINSWKNVVGLQLAHKTCPTRLINGRLYLAVADSQWMQTLVFLKPKIIEKLKEIFPDIKITDILGKPGAIPPEVEKIVKNAEWPDWHCEDHIEMPGIKDESLLEQLDICRKKLNARLKGLESRGYKLCLLCKASVTQSEEGVCAVCQYNSREEERIQVETIIADMPWLTHEELLGFDPNFTLVEYEAIRARLLDDCLRIIDDLAADIAVFFDENNFKCMKKEMIRAMMLFTGSMPDQVDLYSLSADEFPDRNWLEYLAITPGEKEC